MSVNLIVGAAGNNISDSLSTSVGAADSTIPVNNISLWPNSTYTVVIDRGLSTEEFIAVSGVSGSSLTVAGRGQQSTTGVGHNAGATIESVPTAGDWNGFKTALLNLVLASTGALDTTKVVDLTTAQTLSNKRRTRRVVTVTQSATPAINSDTTDVASITGLAQAITSMTTSLTGTPNSGDLLEIQITDNGTARAITWGTSFESTGNVTLPTTTVISTLLRIGLEWNATASKWDCVAVA